MSYFYNNSDIPVRINITGNANYEQTVYKQTGPISAWTFSLYDNSVCGSGQIYNNNLCLIICQPAWKTLSRRYCYYNLNSSNILI